MAVQFFLVLFFETKYDLYGTCALGYLAGFCDDNMGRISIYQLHESSSHQYKTYSNICAVTSLPATESLAMPS